MKHHQTSFSHILRDQFKAQIQLKSSELKEHTFDLLIVGGGITGAAVARDAALRGLSVALVEMGDFGHGTSSKSSKLIHGGLRYLENFELGLVFEALSERALLLKTAPNLVQPLPFFWPIFKKDLHGKAILSLGLWFYDLLALFRSPGVHQRLSKTQMLKAIPNLKAKELLGGFQYFDAQMWDDVMVVEILRAAAKEGASVLSYTKAKTPLWDQKRLVGFELEDQMTHERYSIRADQVIFTVGPWMDELHLSLNPEWSKILNPSQGIHLVFDLKKIPVPGAVVMCHPKDGRISFVIPRPDYGAGVVIVGTTDSPVSGVEETPVLDGDIDYLMELLGNYFPALQLNRQDILSVYQGIRPLVKQSNEKSLRKVSREHLIQEGIGGSVFIVGGKYTTHRVMAQEVLDFTHQLHRKKQGAWSDKSLKKADTKIPFNRNVAQEYGKDLFDQALALGVQNFSKEIFEILVKRYGKDLLEILIIQNEIHGINPFPEFPYLEAQLVYGIRYEMVMHLEDFYFRRIPLFLARKDHGLTVAQVLAKRLCFEKKAKAQSSSENLDFEIQREKERLLDAVAKADAWRKESHLQQKAFGSLKIIGL